MKNRTLMTILALVTMVLISCAGSMQTVHPIDELVVFGDSLSDMGNVYRTTGKAYPPNPPYFQGRYSNGRIWVEYLADKLKLDLKPANNFAFGGATTGKEFSPGIPDLLMQVQSFTGSHPQANPNALYTVWAGANDYLQGASDTEKVIANVSSAVRSLIAIGAQKILVANLPDLGNLPVTRTGEHSGELRTLTQKHNLALDATIAQFQQQNAAKLQIIKLDAYSIYQSAIAKPSTYGFVNVTGTCLQQRSPCKNPDTFLFWDEIHPTAAAHRILGETAVSKVS